jgi:leucyl aminopeptidase
MNIDAVPVDGLPTGLVAVGVPVFATSEGPVPTVLAGSFPMLDDLDPEWCARHGFTGKVGQTIVAYASASAADDKADVWMVGMGEASLLAGDAGIESLRRASAALVRAIGHGPVAALVLPDASDLPDGASPGAAAGAGGLLQEWAAAAAEGAVLASYRFDEFRTGKGRGVLACLALAVGPAHVDDAQTGAARGARVAESVNMARDLVNEPPSSLTPQRFADFSLERFAAVPQLSVEVWDEDRIVAERLGGLLGVARGSVQPPRFVRISYEPSDPIEIDGTVPHLALVGKGITFDSGGLSLKTPAGMESMKTDMSGAAAVLGALDAAAALGARIKLTGFMPLTENMPGGAAIKPGDVLTTREGKTIEVLNTDAEGRLVLSDALTLAAESGPHAIVDIATLTGAAVVALGKGIAGLLGNDHRLLGAVRAAGDRAGEPLWTLPLPEDYRAHIDSEVADMRNVGRPGQGGSIAAALLLQEFVGSVPWAHLDIAGPARSDEASHYFAKGGTGFGVRTLVALATSEEFAGVLTGLGTVTT